MNTERTWALLREIADTLEFDETPQVYLPDDAQDLDELLARLSLASSAVRWFQQAARDRMGEHIGQRGFARFGPRVYRSVPDTREKAKPDMQSELWDQLAPYAQRLFNPNYPRWGQLKELFADYVDPDTGEIGFSAFKDRFYDSEGDGWKVAELPADKAPKYMQKSEGVTHRD